MIETIERVRRLGKYDEWPNCDFCCEDFSLGFRFYLDGDHGGGTLCICDGCLERGKGGWHNGWIRQEDLSESAKRFQRTTHRTGEGGDAADDVRL